MGVMTIESSKLLTLLDEVGRSRALTSAESDLVEEIVLLDENRFRWSPRLDQGLERAANSNGGIARFARRHGITPMAAYCRLSRIRGRKGRKVVRGRRKG